MIDIPEIYNTYLNTLRDKNKEKYKDHKGWFSASAAGSCYRKMMYRAMHIDTAPPDAKSNRILRLGTIVHDDFEKSIDLYKESNKADSVEIVTEHRIELPEIKVVGHLDIGIVYKDEEKIHVYDLKTCGAYKWRLKFGRMQNRDKNPSVNYELQIGTYGMGLGREFEITNIDLTLLWYNKDTSMVRNESINSYWIEEAYEYWLDLNEVAEEVEKPEELIPGESPNVPVYGWECKYCEFKDTHCPGVFS